MQDNPLSYSATYFKIKHKVCFLYVTLAELYNTQWWDDGWLKEQPYTMEWKGN